MSLTGSKPSSGLPLHLPWELFSVIREGPHLLQPTPLSVPLSCPLTSGILFYQAILCALFHNQAFHSLFPQPQSQLPAHVSARITSPSGPFLAIRLKIPPKHSVANHPVCLHGTCSFPKRTLLYFSGCLLALPMSPY